MVALLQYEQVLRTHKRTPVESSLFVLCQQPSSKGLNLPSFSSALIAMSAASRSRSPTLVNDTHHTERPLLKLRIPGGASNILNSTVVDTAGRPLYSTLSNSKRTKMISCSDSVEVATIKWDRHSPRMVFRRKKMKCKEWLKLAGPDNKYIPISR